MSEEYNIGDKVWWVKYNRENKAVTCPVCFGKLCVEIILGDSSIVKTECDYCKRGYGYSLGYVDEYKYVSAIEQVAITGKDIREDQDKKVVRYFYNNYVFDPKENIFKTKEEAEEALAKKIEYAEKEDLERRIRNKKGHFQKYSWHVGYYTREKKDALEKIERCDRKIVYFKAKAKEETT